MSDTKQEEKTQKIDTQKIKGGATKRNLSVLEYVHEMLIHRINGFPVEKIKSAYDHFTNCSDEEYQEALKKQATILTSLLVVDHLDKVTVTTN